MQRNEKVLLIRDVPEAIIDALDGVLETQGLRRVATRELAEDWTPLLVEEGGPLMFVLTLPQEDWTACFSSLAPDDEWQLAEALARGLEQPTVYAVISDATQEYAYRYFADGVLHEEFLPDAAADLRLDLDGLLARLAGHDIPLALIDDRVLSFGAEHLVVAYSGDGHSAHAAPDEPPLAEDEDPV